MVAESLLRAAGNQALSRNRAMASAKAAGEAVVHPSPGLHTDAIDRPTDPQRRRGLTYFRYCGTGFSLSSERNSHV